MSKYLSLEHLTMGFNQIVRRFPVALVMLVLLTIDLLARVQTKAEPSSLTFFFATGTLLALVLHLCTEETERWHIAARTGESVLLWLVSFLLLGADSIALHMQERIEVSTLLAQSIFILSMIVTACFLPFWHEKDDQQSWNFVFRVALSAMLACLVSMVMLGGLTSLYYGSCTLFGFNANQKLYISIVILCMVALQGLLFLIRIPSGTEKHDAQLPNNHFVLGTVRYLFLPLALLYLGVLYVYGLRIVFTWTLPHGTLSTLVSTLMAGYILITFLYYPYRDGQQGVGYERRLLRWMPLLVLPLLVLMSVGIGRRFMDYGLTAKRLYILTLNLWFYAVAIGLWLWQGRRIRWIAISAVVLLVATSCHPWNYYKVYANLLIDRYSQVVSKYPVENFPKDEVHLRSYLSTMSGEDAEKLYEAMLDMRGLDYDMLSRVTGFDGFLYLKYADFMDDEHHSAYDERITYTMKDALTIGIPTGFNSMKYVNEDFTFSSESTSSEESEIIHRGWDCTDTSFTVSLDGSSPIVILYNDLEDDEVYQFVAQDSSCVFVPTSIDFYKGGSTTKSTNLEGYLFTK